jgi:hypothetical protein
MNRIRATIVFPILMAIGFASIFFQSCSSNPAEGIIILTRTSNGSTINNYSADSLRNFQSQIVALDPGQPGNPPEILTSGYYSARSPQVSYNGKFLLFTARIAKNDPWQVWEMNLSNHKTSRITNLEDNCTDPAYLPGERIVFSRFTEGDSLHAGYSLYTCATDGSNMKRITFNPHTYLSSNVLNDGRILTIGKQKFPTEGQAMFMVMRPDGTKAELFYKTKDGSKLSGAARETPDGKLVFIESAGNPSRSNIISINYNRPLYSGINLTSQTGGDCRSVFPENSGTFLITYRKSTAERYSLYRFDPGSGLPGKALYSDNEYDVTEAVITGAHSRPKMVPSEVDMGVKTGLLLCQDINFMSESSFSGIEIIGIDSTLGATEVEEDGSFYLKIIADKPFRIQTVDDKGNKVGSPSEWIWVRPNERRGCVGCHEDPEMVPANRIPLAVKNSPVIIPGHIDKIVEKKVSLE